LTSVTITFIDLGDDQVSVRTDAVPPAVGRRLTRAEALAMEFLGTSFRRGAEVIYDRRQIPAISLALELNDPEGLGHAATPCIRARARDVVSSISTHAPVAGVDIDQFHQTRRAT